MKYKLLYIVLLFATLQTFAQNTVKYDYDLLNRLTKVTYSNGVTIAYTYDELGNRLSKKITGANANTFTVTISVTPEGSGSVTGSGKYSNGTTVELNAIANEGYVFSKWSDGVTDNPRTLTVTADVQLTAEFKEAQSTLIGDVNGDGRVDMADVMAIVNKMLDKADANFDIEMADMNGDGRLTIADIIKLISILPQGDVNITDGLVAYYPFNGNANDESGNGNHGQPTENVVLTTGIKGEANGAYQFGGFYNSGHIKVNNSETLKFNGEATFAVYVKPTNWSGMDGWATYVSQGNHCIFAKSLDRIGGSFSYNGNSEQFNVGSGSFTQKWLEIGSDDKVKGNYINKWIHLAFVYSSTHARLYVNGQLVNEKEITPDFTEMNQEDLYMGSFPLIGSWADWWYPMEGAIDEFRIYNRALTADEVQTLAKHHDWLDGSLEGGAGGGSDPDVVPLVTGDDEGM